MKNKLEYLKKVSELADKRRLVIFFFVIILPIAIGLLAFIHWHNSIVGEPTPMDLLLRAVVAIIAFGIGLFLIVLFVFKPAIDAAKKEGNNEEQAKESEEISHEPEERKQSSSLTTLKRWIRSS